MQTSDQLTEDTYKVDMLRLRRLILWHLGGAMLLFVALMLAHFMTGDLWVVASWTVGVFALIVTSKGAFDFGRGAQRKRNG